MRMQTPDGFVQVNPTPSGCLVGTYTKTDKPLTHIALTWADAEALRSMLTDAIRDKDIHGPQ